MNQFFLEAAGAAESGGIMGSLMTFGPLILIFVVMYFLMIRPQKKREKAVQEMRSKIEVGDEIVTVGGIIGLVVSIRDDSIVLETGNDRSKIRVARWAIQTNSTVKESGPEVK